MGAARMKPRASMPTTLVIGPSNGATSSSVAARKASASPSRGVMSLNTTPGCGKSGMSRMNVQRSSAEVTSPTSHSIGGRPHALRTDRRDGGASGRAGVGSGGTSGGSVVHDLVIRNGTVIDGLGAAARDSPTSPSTTGRITAVGTVDEPGREEIDATGLAVTPGFVDVHTHYDGQVTWDPLLTPSIWHGVTTVVMGNCGVGFAPAAPDRHDWLIGLMEGVEGIPGTSLREAIRWDWETVGEYLDALDRIPRAIDVAAQVPHGAVRAFVMGERGAANEPATDDDIIRMAEVVADGVAAGAVGLSVNRLELHKAVDGREVPGTFADARGDLALVRAACACRRPTRCSPPSCPGPRATSRERWDQEVDWLTAVSRETGLVGHVPVRWRARRLVARQARPHRAENANGARIVPQVSSHGQGLLCGLRTSHPFRGRPHVRVARRPAGRRARRAHGRTRRSARRSSPSARRPASRASATSCSRSRPRGLPVAPAPRVRTRPGDAASPRSRRPSAVDPEDAALRLDDRRRRRRTRPLLPRWLPRQPRRQRRAARAPGHRPRPRRRRRPRRPHLRRRLPVVPALVLGA